MLTRQRKFAEAENTLRQALSLKLMRFPEDHWEVAITKNLLGACLNEAADWKRTEPLLAECYQVIRKQFGPVHRTRRAGARLLTCYEKSAKKE